MRWTTEAVAKYAELEDRVNDRKDAMEEKRKELDSQVTAPAWRFCRTFPPL